MMNIVEARRQNREAANDLIKTIQGPTERRELDWQKMAMTGSVAAALIAIFKHIA